MCDSTHCSANDRVGTVRSACPRRCRSASMHGFGLATARTMCEDGARVVVTRRSSERAEEGSSERAEEVAAALPNAMYGCDLLAADGAARLFGESTKRVGNIDILVLNGPGPAPRTAADVDDAGVDSAVAASVKPQVQLVRWDPLRGQSSCPCGGQCRRSESDHPRLDEDPLRAAFSSPKGRQSDLLGHPQTPGWG